MPLYEYQCGKCGHRFEKIESISASEVKKCPECGDRAERLLNAPAIQFKGTGWYVTDYADKNSAAASKESSDSKDGAAPAKAGEKSTEKTAAKDSAREPAKKTKEK